MTGPGPLVQPNPSTQQFKVVIRNPQKININERFTGIMQAKGHISPFAKGQSNEREEIRVEAADGPSRSRRTSIMSDSDYQTDAVDNAFKRALKKVAPNMQPLEEEESEASFTSSHRSEQSQQSSVQSSHAASAISATSAVSALSKASEVASEASTNISGTTMSSIPSMHSGISAATDITTGSERSTNTTSTTSAASTVQLNTKRLAEQEKMELESEAGRSINTSLSELSSSKNTDQMDTK